MLSALKSHPLPIEAFFRYSLVLTYAFPENFLKPMIGQGLELDTYEGHGFVAIALVATEHLRPAGFPPWLGTSFFLSGYRIFTRFERATGQRIRGLKILRSDTNRRMMGLLGNLMTHYRYTVSRIETRQTDTHLSVSVQTPNGEADLKVTADLSLTDPSLPAGSLFPDWRTARRFAGPLPFTFSYEETKNAIVVVEGVRDEWQPKCVAVDVQQASFFEHGPWASTTPILASAFYLEHIPYRWKRGVVEPLKKRIL